MAVEQKLVRLMTSEEDHGGGAEGNCTGIWHKQSPVLECCVLPSSFNHHRDLLFQIPSEKKITQYIFKSMEHSSSLPHPYKALVFQRPIMATFHNRIWPLCAQNVCFFLWREGVGLDSLSGGKICLQKPGGLEENGMFTFAFSLLIASFSFPEAWSAVLTELNNPNAACCLV